ncbi:MAG: DUF3810 family protein [Oscillospiraceae bacterium]
MCRGTRTAASPRRAGEIFERSTEVYAALYDEFPFLRLAGGERRPKAFRCSDALSAIGFTGFFFPFTGEANLNVDSPAAWLPSTICHELAHLRGVASEQECNFIAILAATRSDDPAYRYSGWLLGYIYLANALYRYAPDRWQAIRETLTESVVADIRANNAYWAQFEARLHRVGQGLRLLPQGLRRRRRRAELRYGGGSPAGVLSLKFGNSKKGLPGLSRAVPFSVTKSFN